MTLASVSGSETSPVVGAPSGPPKAASCPPHDLRREARTAPRLHAWILPASSSCGVARPRASIPM